MTFLPSQSRADSNARVWSGGTEEAGIGLASRTERGRLNRVRKRGDQTVDKLQIGRDNLRAFR